MKNIQILLLSLLVVGCSTTKTEKLDHVQKLSYLASYVGTKAALLQNPEYRIAFELAYSNLDNLVTTGTINGPILREILSHLPVKELKGDEAKIAIEGATVLYDITIGNKVSIEAQPYVFAAATGIRNGMKIALGKWMPFSTQKFVLLVDDEDIVADVFTRVFSDQSYALLDIANTVEKALAKINFVVYDYIFLDMKMDDNSESGMRILRALNRMLIKLRSEKRAAMDSFVVIMSSSVPLQDVMAEANSLGVLTFLDKPINFTEEYLLGIVQRLGLPLQPRKSKV